MEDLWLRSGEGDLELVPVNYYGRLWDNQTRTTFQGGGKRIQYLGSYAADPSALYKAKGNTNFTIGSDGHPVARSTDDIVFQENNNVNGWDINEVRSYYYWVHDKTKRSLGNAQGRAHNYGGDLASFNPKGVTNSNNWWFDYIMMKKATKETLRPYTIKQTYLARQPLLLVQLLLWLVRALHVPWPGLHAHLENAQHHPLRQ